MNRLLHPRHWSLGVKGGVIIAASLALLLGSAATSYTLERSTAAATADMLRTMQVQADIQRLHTQIAEAATGVRGYLLTGRDDFLTPYRVASQQLPATMARLQETVSDPEQRRRLENVRPLLQNKLDSLEVLRGQRNASSVELQQHLLASKQVLDQLRAEIGAMNLHETELVAQRTLALQQASNRNLWMTIAVIAAGLTGALATLTFTFGLVRRVRLAAENAERLNSDLPLKPTLATTDELGQLSDRLHQASVLLAGRASAAQAASQAKTEFLARTSHELRTPLNAILGYAQLLESGLSDQRDHEHAVQIRQAGQHLLSLIDEVLDIGRIEAGKLTLDCTPVALAPLLNEAITLLRPLAQQRSVRLHHDDIGALAVMADRQRLLQVLLNVVSNGIKYGAAGGQVGIVCAMEGGAVAIHIDDNGPGIPAAMEARLFTPFDRLGIERGKTEGAGLGLAVSKSLMQAMHGDIRHQPGPGTRFTLTLPAATAPTSGTASGPAPSQAQVAPAVAATHGMVCIDDDAATRTLIATLMLRRPHWRVATVADTADGIALAAQWQPDLLLVASGQASAELRASGSALVLLGAAPHADAPQRHLAKPLNVPAFFALLDLMEQTR
ncbi:histidine kinase [Duganella rhizosphaerae]|uniref:hybrid sensor histidine kinase/response regulator n=1 Tax=Duganella rhizosphaerae TaxID=2885763 RepID=UPI0030EAD375